MTTQKRKMATRKMTSHSARLHHPVALLPAWVRPVEETEKIPTARVLEYAEKAHGTPIAWKEREDGTVVIVFEDGRKIVFEKEGEE